MFCKRKQRSTTLRASALAISMHRERMSRTPEAELPETEWLTESQVARWLGIAPATLRAHRLAGIGIASRAAVKFGDRSVRYHRGRLLLEVARELAGDAA